MGPSASFGNRQRPVPEVGRELGAERVPVGQEGDRSVRGVDQTVSQARHLTVDVDADE